jgi:hypothetical protein
MKYQHRQKAKWMSFIFIIAFIITSYAFLNTENPWPIFLVLGLLGFCMIVFSSLTVTIKDEYIDVSFGGELVKEKIKLSDIESCRQVHNQWYNGWGVRWFPGGWLFNVSGFSAVELKLKNGRLIRIGTDEPAKLEEAIQKELQ